MAVAPPTRSEARGLAVQHALNQLPLPVDKRSRDPPPVLAGADARRKLNEGAIDHKVQLREACQLDEMAPRREAKLKTASDLHRDSSSDIATAINVEKYLSEDPRVNGQFFK